ncbi:phospho-sugar mutase [Rhodoluna lacicola]|uniref:Phosphomannomutase n=1 Tax=Rhodoluna lacicola TaxID=529884 RepID=A0A060JGS3_9MICO|nr:phospho-sugar mutase [Rhodoluna lacicola]AIC47935.1 Phosphomannomutase [Rhodoluna lacicola]
MTTQLFDAARAWAAQDPDTETREELLALIAAGDTQAIEARMGSRLDFGTAGLRGELGAGPNRMNRVLVAQAAAGIRDYVNENFKNDASVVIGFDGRINSAIFARDSAEIFAAAGISTMLFDGVVPTPVLAFAGKHLNASAAIMVTASHNPPRDNGYKVYLGGANGGSQIISPTDKQIADKIRAIAASQTFDEIPKSTNYEVIGDEIRQAYVAETASLTGEIENAESLKIVYTAMHGVGWRTTQELFEAVGLPKPFTVDEQLLPDGNFPTVAFPNPEEPGAMDLAFAKAREVGADLIIANDPDADRLAIGVPDSSVAEGWRRLTGDEIGLLLGYQVARRAVADGKTGALACSIVSSSALGKVANHFGLEYQETLTGFKWISKVPNLLFGYEEALGYCVDPQRTPDKDGISAALIAIAMAAELASQGKTLTDQLAELGELFGHYATGQISMRVTDLSVISSIMQNLRANPPVMIDGVEAKFTDLSIGTDKLGPTDGLRFDLADGRRVIVRPSGTEPKLKCYLQAVGESKEAATATLASLNDAMKELLK